jgi:uncharacterized repeat protein (TIGR03806 family)
MKRQQPNERVLPYDLITPLYSDYAYKARFVWMPDSARAEVNAEGTLEFPENTVLIKTFYYPDDFRRPEGRRRLLETRLLVKRQGNWEAFAYLWNAEQTEARLNLIGDFLPARFVDERGVARRLEYVVPNKNQCKSCHNVDNTLQPIGPKARNLNRAFVYPDGSEDNQLARWQREGLLAPGEYAAVFPGIAAWDDSGAPLEARALAYLDVNCGHCHHPRGPAHTTGLYLTVDYQAQRNRLGVCKTPVAAGKGSGGHRYGIAPGRPDASILIHRMLSEEPGVMMPELGRVLPHQEGIALLRQWIEAMEGDCGAPEL